MNVMQARRNVERQIASNPSSIALRRSRDVSDGAGGSYRETMELPAQTVRIFMTAAASTEAAGVGGHVRAVGWGLLGAWDADIAAGDEFAHRDRRFRVRSVNPASTGGQVTAIQAEIEEVS